MRTRSRMPLFLIAMLLPALASHDGARGDDGRRRKDHDLARQALERGEVMPLDAVLAEIRKSVPGEIVGVELEGERGKWIYEIKVIGPTGVMTKVKADAATGAVLRTKEK